MKWITHQTGALAAGLAFSLPTPGIIAALVGAVTPDIIDQSISKSAPTRKEKQKLFNKIHRGDSHWFGWWLAFFIICLTFLPFAPVRDIAAGFLFGALSHVFLDMLTPAGIPVLPFSRKKKLALPLCITGQPTEYVFLACLMLVCALLAFPDFFLKILNMKV